MALAVASVAVLAGLAASSIASELSQESLDAAIAALRAGIEVERDILKTHQDHYRQAAADRNEASRKLQAALNELDAIAQTDGGLLTEAFADKQREAADAESRRLAASDKCLEILGRIRECEERIGGLEKKVASLRESLPRPRESLTGSWQVNYLPGGNRGVFVLKQTGTIVQGQYQLDGGWKGSLQGTFIDGKLYLQRIDSKLGRSSELEAFLSEEGRLLRGTWRNYNMTDGAAASGSWTASRQDE